MRYRNVIPAAFIDRPNRFIAHVEIGGRRETVHVKNTGQCAELLTPGAQVTLAVSDRPQRRTRCDLVAVWKGDTYINMDSQAPNIIAAEYLPRLFPDLEMLKREVVCGDSRFDFYMEKQGQKFLREVKGCTLTVDPKTGIGYFPDAPTERGVKHLNELAEAVKNGFHCAICFVIQMNGVHMVYPNNTTQPEFGRALIHAAKAGVSVLYYSCHVEADSIKITGETCDYRYAGM